MTKNLLLVDSLTRKNCEDPIYLDRALSFQYGHIFFSLGKERPFIKNKSVSRILGITVWKFLQGHYYTKIWEDFLGVPINPDGTLWVKEKCPDTNCGALSARNPKDINFHCPECNSTYLKPLEKPAPRVTIFEKHLKRLQRDYFCHSCGKNNPCWSYANEIYLCQKCFQKVGDPSFDFNEGLSTKLHIPASILLSAGKEAKS